MKKIIISFCVVTLACVVLIATLCFAQQTTENSSGEWTLNAQSADNLNEETKAVFETATSVLPVNYDLIALLGMREIESVSYAFLAVASADFIPEPTLAVVIINVNPEGNAVFSSYAPFTIADLLNIGAGDSEGDSASGTSQGSQETP